MGDALIPYRMNVGWMGKGSFWKKRGMIEEESSIRFDKHLKRRKVNILQLFWYQIQGLSWFFSLHVH